MQQDFDVTIIGAGLIGMMTARELVLAGKTVRILDQGGVGRESSWAGGGILSPLYPWRYPEAVSALARWGHVHYADICDDLLAGSDIDPQWTRSGLLILGDEELEQAQTWAEANDMPLQHWSAAQLRSAEPRLGAQGPALWLPEIAQVRNPRLVRALEQYLRRRGVVFQTDTAVAGFAVRDGQLLGLHTATGLLSATRVISCTGAWSQGLWPDLAIEPVKGQMLVFAAEPGRVSKIVLDDGRYVIPRRDGHVVVGSTLEYTGFDKSTSEVARESLLETALRLYPELSAYPVERHWAGLRPGSPQGIPFIGSHPQVAGLYINAGHFRNGVIIGAASARLAADLLLGRETVVAPQAYVPAAAVWAGIG